MTDDDDLPPEFDAYVRLPVAGALGRRLAAVAYGLLDTELAAFDPDAPNATGSTTVELRFDGGISLRLCYAFHGSLRRPYFAYHLAADGATATPPFLAGGGYADGGASPPWREAVGTRLLSAAVFGLGTSPQAVALQFEGAGVVVSLGTVREDGLIVSDGCDMLVFPADEWERRLAEDAGIDPPWRVLWEGH